jgi:hypothetical protein
MKSLPVRPGRGRFFLLVVVARRQPVEAAPASNNRAILNRAQIAPPLRSESNFRLLGFAAIIARSNSAKTHHHLKTAPYRRAWSCRGPVGAGDLPTHDLSCEVHKLCIYAARELCGYAGHARARLSRGGAARAEIVAESASTTIP